jgi:hypothetical protein
LRNQFYDSSSIFYSLAPSIALLLQKDDTNFLLLSLIYSSMPIVAGMNYQVSSKEMEESSVSCNFRAGAEQSPHCHNQSFKFADIPN